MLSLKAYVGTENKSAEKVPPVGIEPETLGPWNLLCNTPMPS